MKYLNKLNFASYKVKTFFYFFLYKTVGHGDETGHEAETGRRDEFAGGARDGAGDGSEACPVLRH